MSFAMTTRCTPGRRTLGSGSLLAMALILGLLCASATQAKNFKQYPLTGNSRTQIGDGLPLPITFTAPPNGKVDFNGIISQTSTGPAPHKVVLPPAGLKWGPQTATIPLHALNGKVFQIRTSLIITAPAAGAHLSAGGRTGPAIFTWCPGLPLPTGTVNPSCTNPNTISSTYISNNITVKASIRYQKTLNQFGGVSQPKVGGGSRGGASLAIAPNGVAPCNGVGMTGTSTCFAIFSHIVPAATGVVGGPIGNSNMFTPGLQPVHMVNVDSVGNIISAGPAFVSISGNKGTTVGGPWTTGKVTVKAPNAVTSAETFYLEGHDGRTAGGVGSLSLVAGGVSSRSLSGDNANRGWLNYTIGAAIPVPSLSNSALIALAGILLASAIWMARRSFATAR